MHMLRLNAARVWQSYVLPGPDSPLTGKATLKLWTGYLGFLNVGFLMQKAIYLLRLDKPILLLPKPSAKLTVFTERQLPLLLRAANGNAADTMR